MKKYISDRLQEVKLLETGKINGIEYELVLYMYKGKEPVYYTFFKGTLARGIMLGLSPTSIMIKTRWILENRYPYAYQILDGYFMTRKPFNFTKLKLLKIIR